MHVGNVINSVDAQYCLADLRLPFMLDQRSLLYKGCMHIQIVAFEAMSLHVAAILILELARYQLVSAFYTFYFCSRDQVNF